MSSVKYFGKKAMDDIEDKISEGKDDVQDNFEHATKEVKEATHKVKDSGDSFGDMVKDKVSEVAVDYATSKTKNIFLRLIEKLIKKIK